LRHFLLFRADAGADYSSLINEFTGYDMVQNTANGGQFEAVVKLVEAGASWRLPTGHPRTMAGSVFYAGNPCYAEAWSQGESEMKALC
jgi:hypothetical protein